MRLHILFVCCFLAALLPAQTAQRFFKPLPESAVALPDGAVRQVNPSRYHVFQLNQPGMEAALAACPREFTPEARAQKVVIDLPLADGTFEAFSLWETAMLEPELAEQAPYIHTYAGYSLRDTRKTVHISQTLQGFHAVILRPDFGIEYVERYAARMGDYYLSYDMNDLPDDQRPKSAAGIQIPPSALENTHEQPYTPPVENRGTLAGPVSLKTFKIIVSTTGEFGTDNGTTLQEVFSAVADKIMQINAIYERDMAIRFQLVQASLLVIFLSPNGDPYNGSTPGDWMGQIDIALNGANIPVTAYDIGHVFARGGGGIAGGSACIAGKERGCTAGTKPYGSGFIGVACQEIGHQLSAGHTWNRCGGFAPDQRKGGSAFEPGSGSTILSYAGGCGPDNVQDFMDLYFHAGTIAEFTNFLQFGPGSSCGTNTPTGNNAPEVTLPYSNNFYIPILTPFELNGSATDPDGDALTYCWEQMNTGPETPLDAPIGTAPLFRTLPAVNVSNRYFPNLNTVRSNGFDVTEQLAGWTRDMNFRLTVRDNHPGGGGTGSADVAFKTWEGAGPFRVQSPNTNTDVWHIGEYANVTWDVANSDKAPVSCKRVNIRLSTDGGLTYPITLASNVGNDGSHYVLVPDVPTTNARVRVDGAGNVFYDISNNNFKIQAATQPSLTVAVENDFGDLCLPAQHSVQVLTAGVLGFNAPVTLSLPDPLPANVTATWSTTTLQPGESATLTLDFSQVTEENTFTIPIRAEATGAGPYLRDVVLTTFRNDFSALALTLPPNGATNLQLQQTLHWNKALDALTYDVQFGKDPSFAAGTILATQNNTTLDSFKMSLFLDKGTPYYWRVRPRNECGVHSWTDAFFFSTFYEKCVSREANDLPKSISASVKSTIESKLSVIDGGAIKNLEVKQLKGFHEYFGDLDVRLISPQGTEVVLWSDKCANSNAAFDLRLTDEAPVPFGCPPPKNGQAARPENPLSVLYGQNGTGTWTLRIKDTEIGGGGSFEIFQLAFCSDAIVNPPYLVNNNPLLIAPGTNQSITPDLLLVEDSDNTHSQLRYTLVTPPRYGHLERAWTGIMKPGAYFTQADIDNGALRYFDYGGNSGQDYFTFTVTDGQGGFFGTPKFIIQPFPVGAGEPVAPALNFRIFPNPASDAVWVALDLPASADLRVALHNAAGQRLREAQLPAGTERLLLSTADLPRGLYFVEVQGRARKLVLRD